MAQCPNCHSQIEIGSEYLGGLFTCQQCQSVYFISFDGVPEGSPAEEVSNEAPTFQGEPSSLETRREPDFASSVVSEPLDHSLDAQPDYSTKEPQEVMTDPLQEIVDFGNNETVATPISYNLRLKGIDLTRNVEDLQSVFNDSKLEMNFDQLKSKIRNGELFIEKIEPGKAAVISQRLRALPFTMIWEQKIYE